MEQQDSKIRLVHWNVNTQFHRNPADIDPELLFDSRAPGIAELINDKLPDVVCLVEIRNLADANITVRKFLEMFHPCYDVHYVPYSSDVFTFYAAILVNRERFWLNTTIVVPLGDVPPEDKRRRVCYGLRLKDRITSKSLWVLVTHFHIYEDLKNASVETLISELGRLREPIVLVGDFNFFFDKDGLKQHDRLVEGLELQDVTYPITLAGEECVMRKSYSNDKLQFGVDGTFHGYGYDSYKANVVCDRHQNNLLIGLSNLDWVFVKGLKKTGRTKVHGFSVVELMENRGFSDHLPLFVELDYDQ